MAATKGTVANPTLTEAILNVLAESPIPVTTPDLIAIVATGLSHPRQRVWTQLRRLYHSGRVECQSGIAIRTRNASRNSDSQHDQCYRVMRWRLAS